VAEDTQALIRSGAWYPLERDVVRVTGPDAVDYLQGQASQDVSAIEPGDAAWSLLLSPQGKVDAWVRIVRWDHDDLLLDVDPGFAGLVQDRLERFKLRTKATITHDPNWSFFAVRGPVEVQVEHDIGAPVVALPIWWPGMVGYDLLAPAGVDVHIGAPRAEAHDTEAVRIECGVPHMGTELTDRTIAAEVGAWFVSSSVSFTKGCYTGQELVARLDARGSKVARHLRGLVIEGDGLPPAGAEVVRDGAVVGELTSRAHSSALGKVVGLAYVGRAVEPDSQVELRWSDGDGSPLTAEVRELPLIGSEPSETA
jgi:tRNA-modifying protein YgfZ